MRERAVSLPIPYNRAVSTPLPVDQKASALHPRKRAAFPPLQLPFLYDNHPYPREYNTIINPSLIYARFKQSLPYIPSGSDKLVNLS